VLKRHPLGAFALLALTFTWAAWLPLVARGAVVGPGAWPSHAPGLLGPALAALVVVSFVSGRAGLAELARGLVRWRVGWLPALVVASPLLLFFATSLVTRRLGSCAAAAFGVMNGFPLTSPFLLWPLLVVGALGEELGWRGFLYTELRRRHGWLAAGLLVVPLWALWHVPAFFLIETYRGFGPGTLVGFVLGLASGGILLGWLYEKSGRSLLAVSLWHGTFNLFTATAAARGALAAVETTAVLVLVAALVVVELARRRRGSHPHQLVTKATVA
jgi:membrane protease YdiL (CAAX protease family)